MNVTTTEAGPETTQAPLKPGAAVIECIEQHPGPDRYEFVGTGSILAPNLVRINGVAIWCTDVDPVVVQSVHIDGTCKSSFVVRVRMSARLVNIGDIPVSVGGPGAEPGDRNRAAMLEIPLSGELRAGQLLEPPYVYLNGNPLYIGGPVEVERIRTPWGGGIGHTATVVVPLLCRRFTVDDEVVPERDVTWPSRRILLDDGPAAGAADAPAE